MSTSVKPSERRKARHMALQALYQWQVSKTPSNEIESQFLVDYDMTKVDKLYFHELVHQVPAQVHTLDETISPFLDRQIKELTPIELAILRMSTYELTQRIDVPYKVIINEGVQLAKSFGATEGHRYVNGVLDKIAQRVRSVEIRSAAR